MTAVIIRRCLESSSIRGQHLRVRIGIEGVNENGPQRGGDQRQGSAGEMTLPSNSLPHTWKRWLAENKISGTDDSTLTRVLAAQGFDELVVARELLNASANPYFQAGQWAAQRLNKLESLSDVRSSLSSLSPRNAAVDRRSALSQQEFLDNYYSANRPVLVTGAMSDWKALFLWNPAYLKHRCGDEIVEIMSDRNSDPIYQINSDLHKRQIRFSDYVDLVSRGPSNDYYLLANSAFFSRENTRWMFDHIGMFPEYLDADSRWGTVFFWFGPAGTVTPLHHDKQNILFSQVYGRKQVTLVSPDQSQFLYNEIGVFSRIDIEHPDYEAYPLFHFASPMVVTLHPGETLFIPVGWWHHVRALDVSISVSFLNFAFPNHYEIPDVYVDRGTL